MSHDRFSELGNALKYVYIHAIIHYVLFLNAGGIFPWLIAWASMGCTSYRCRGTMVHISFNLLFDSEMEQVIRAFSSHLVEAGIPERALVKYQPHITLVAYEVEKVHLYKTPLTLMASALDPFPLFLDSLGIFPEQGVIFLAPRIFDSLLSLHRATTETFMSMSEHERPSLVGDYLLPGRWIPHVTLAKHLPIPHVLKALEVCLRQWTPVQGHATGIGMRVHPDPANYHYYSFHSSPG